MTLIRKAKRDAKMGPVPILGQGHVLPAPCCRGARGGRLGLALAPSCRELSRAVPMAFPGSCQPPAVLPPVAPGWGPRDVSGLGRQPAIMVAQILPCPCTGTALLPPCPMCPPPRRAGIPLPQGCPPLLVTPGLDPLVLSVGTFLRCAWACSLERSPGDGAIRGATAAVTQGHPAGGWQGPILHPGPLIPPAPRLGSLHLSRGDEDTRACLSKAKETSSLCTQSVISVNYA